MTLTTSGDAASAYDTLAPWYDAFTAASDYEAWTRHVLKLARQRGLRGNTLLDIACGTGKSFLPFLRRGFHVTGCDASTQMLARARAKAPEARLVRADMRDLAELGQFDLVTCFDDSLNYLLTERDLAGAFGSIAANLGASGVALFDLNTLLAYRTTFAGHNVTIRDGAVLVWRGESAIDAEPGCCAAAWIDVFDPSGSGLYERATTHHAQRHFPPDRVTPLLAKAGLECVGVYGVLDDGALVAEVDETTQLKTLYAARPMRGGDAQ